MNFRNSDRVTVRVDYIKMSIIDWSKFSRDETFADGCCSAEKCERFSPAKVKMYTTTYAHALTLHVCTTAHCPVPVHCTVV